MYSYSTPFIEPRRAHPMRIGALLILLAVTAGAAALGSIAGAGSQDFYLALNRPAWAPPPGVFGPVWSVLYLLMAIAAWTVVRFDDAPRSKMVLYVVQLAANALWTWLFFYWHSGILAFADIIVLLVLIASMIVSFARVKPVAGLLLAPYFAWVSFATALTWAVWKANPAVL